ncbi:hypothetical protein CEXT_42481 [Caerostris extrusa]|uniref:Uncharacterized protein n=1 Tax=Caerostris extrusa TaxID=172846 RepID=A0AAV4MAJ8_CAEEX|nr:hypothetical protein CEXT_42481 [Caerostris extrusa]
MDDKNGTAQGRRGNYIQETGLTGKGAGRKESEWSVRNTEFIAQKQKIAISSVNCDNGERFTAEEVKELLRKEEEAQEILEGIRLEAIRKRYF